MSDIMTAAYSDGGIPSDDDHVGWARLVADVLERIFLYSCHSQSCLFTHLVASPYEFQEWSDVKRR